MHKQGKGYRKRAKALNVPRDAVGNIIRKFRIKGTRATLPERGGRRRLSPATTRFLRRQVVKNPSVTAKDLQQDLAAADT